MRSRATAAVSATALTLLLASTAFAGGWANAIMDAPPDDPGGPNQPITIGFTLLQHGVTPVDWGPTQIVLTNGATGETVTFDAQPQGAVGHWVAEVSVPADGTWTYLVRHDLEIGMTGFSPITVGGTAAATGSASTLAVQPALLMVGGFLALLVVVAAAASILAYRHTRLDRASA
ncbi:MAG TPA: hypothetical protein VFH90_07780 [Candidatus Limnocylindria bacterium]|nr:hypothetical protein [Candidatus Limnocylindria bacterium]